MENKFAEHLWKFKFFYGIGAILAILIIALSGGKNSSESTNLQGNVRSLFSAVKVTDARTITNLTPIYINGKIITEITVDEKISFTVGIDSGVKESFTVTITPAIDPSTQPIVLAKGVKGTGSFTLGKSITPGTYFLTVTGDLSRVSTGSRITITKL